MVENGRAKWKDLLNDPDIKRWYRSMARGSPLTAEVSLRRLGRACELLGTDHRGLVERARENMKAFMDSLDDMVSSLEEQRKSPGYIDCILKVLKSWLRYHEIKLTRKISITNSGRTPTIEDEQVPSQEELARIFRGSPPRVRVAESLMALADLRPETLSNHLGTDGLKLGDLPELRIEGRKVAFKRVPTMVVVRPGLSKAKHRYFTFLGEEGCTYLKEYLEARLRERERLTPDSPVIGREARRHAANEFIRTTKIGNLIRQSMRKAGVRKRPYVLRAYAETQLIIAESKGKISHPYLQFIAGHRGDIEARYSTNKGRLPPDMVEDIRSAYKACEPFLSTTVQPLEQTAVVKEAKVEALKSIAKNLLGIDIAEVKVAKEKEAERELTPDEEIELFENEIKKMREEEKDPQIVVMEEERVLFKGRMAVRERPAVAEDTNQEIAYLRKRPYHRDSPTQPQREARLQLAETAIREGRGKTGTVKVVEDGREREVPASAVPIMRLKGKVFTKTCLPPPASSLGEEALEQPTASSGGAS